LSRVEERGDVVDALHVQSVCALLTNQAPNYSLTSNVKLYGFLTCCAKC
jgi:hypothetical protein